MNCLDTAKYFSNAYSVACIPVAHDKRPLLDSWHSYQNRCPTDFELENMFSNASSIACIGGKIQCIDFDEKYARGIYNQYFELAKEVGLEDVVNKCLLQSTPSGGYHLVFKCQGEMRNQKLAKCEDGKVAIETRGSGGYFLIAPSDGYQVINGTFEDLKEITVDERDALLEVARSFNAKHPAEYTSTSITDCTPGDDYDQRGDVTSLLRSRGWTPVGKYHWRRPGKSTGISASWNHIPGRFYVFTTSTEFESEKVYKPWHVYAVLECGGDFRLAATQLSALGYGTQKPKTLSERLQQQYNENQVRISTNENGEEIVEESTTEYPEIKPYYINNLDEKYNEMPPEIIKGILHQGCKMILSAPSKARKSFLMLDLALSIAGGAHWLGFETIKTPVLFIDFEFKTPMFAKRRKAIFEKKYVVEGVETQNIPFYELLLRGYDVNLDKLRKHITSFIKKMGIGFVVFDPIYKIEDFDENKAQDVSALLKWFEMLCSSLNVSIAFSHHYAKGNSSAKESIDRASGSGVWARDPDALLMLTNHEEEEVMVLESHLRNFPPQPPICIKWNTPIWERVTEYSPEDLKGKAKEEKKKLTVVSLSNVLVTCGIDKVNSENINRIAEITGSSKQTIYKYWNIIKSTRAQYGTEDTN